LRKPIIAGNWKMFKTAGQAVILVQDIEKKLYGTDTVEVVVCPPFTALRSVSIAIEADDGLGIELGAQDMHWEEEGAFTGEISPLMLKDLGVKYVIIGHSERRQFFGETDETVNKKVKSALANGLNPIVCVGETLEEHDGGVANKIVLDQLINGLKGIAGEDGKDIVVAYEPIWAIGTGRNATPQEANDVIRHIRAVLGSIFSPDIARGIRIQYGGSVKPENIRIFMEESDIDGALVGGASLKSDTFIDIIKYNK